MDDEQVSKRNRQWNNKTKARCELAQPIFAEVKTRETSVLIFARFTILTVKYYFPLLALKCNV